MAPPRADPEQWDEGKEVECLQRWKHSTSKMKEKTTAGSCKRVTGALILLYSYERALRYSEQIACSPSQNEGEEGRAHPKETET